MAKNDFPSKCKPGWSEMQASSEQKAFWGEGISAAAEVSAPSLQVKPYQQNWGEELRVDQDVFCG